MRLATTYVKKRERLLKILDYGWIPVFKPRGAYYIMTDISRFKFPDDVEFAQYLVKEIGVAAVPGSSFYNDPADGAPASALHLLQNGKNSRLCGRAPQ